MNKHILRSKITPILAVIIIFIFWRVPLGLDYFETVIGAIIALVASAIEYRKQLFSSLGFTKFSSKIKDFFIIAPLVAGLLFLLYYFVLIPVTTHYTGKPIDVSQFDQLRGNLFYSFIMLLFIWVSAAFGEEIIWRGYFMRQFFKFFGNSPWAVVINIVLFAGIFGFLHGYQGITGQIITGIIGMLLAIIFYLRKFDLWFNIVVHGCFDTIALVLIYNGWY